MKPFQASQMVRMIIGAFFLALNNNKDMERKGKAQFLEYNELNCFCANFSRDTLQSRLIIVAS